MIRIVHANGKDEWEFIKEIERRNNAIDEKVSETVAAVLADVKQYGDEAVQKYTEKFDRYLPAQMIFDREDMREYASQCDKAYLNAMENAADNIRAYHKRQVRQSFVDVGKNGVTMGQRIRGLARVGIYVPGGTAGYPSSVLMSAIPAQIAGVREIIMATPPGREGHPDVGIVAAAYVAGIEKIYFMGGAQAIGAMAYGTDTVPRVDKIVGPGNIYVAAAKRMVYGTVDIDMIAGPSEVLIVADGTANPVYLAADLMSQAEHDLLASSILITDDENIAYATGKELERQITGLSRQDIIKKSLADFGGTIVCRSMEKCMELANRFAPEHLEISTADPMQWLSKVENAGSVFLGHYTPEPLGDYYAGPNHVLPTNGTARFFSPLSVDDFVKKSSFIWYTKQELRNVADDVIILAEAEGLTAHANSIKVRL